MKKIVSGFSLIELVIVLVIFGLLMSSLVSVILVHVGQQKINLTQQQLAEIKEALLGFAVREERLPCPASEYEDGLAEEALSPICKREGYLPWANLGVGRYDAWGHPFRYRVENEYSSGLNENSSGLRIRTMSGNFQLTNSTGDSRVVAIIFSCGKNGRPDPTEPAPEDLPMEIDYTESNDADGQRNENKICENEGNKTKTYIYDNNLDNTFDDQLTWLSKYTLIARLMRAGKWPLPPP